MNPEAKKKIFFCFVSVSLEPFFVYILSFTKSQCLNFNCKANTFMENFLFFFFSYLFLVLLYLIIKENFSSQRKKKKRNKNKRRSKKTKNKNICLSGKRTKRKEKIIYKLVTQSNSIKIHLAYDKWRQQQQHFQFTGNTTKQPHFMLLNSNSSNIKPATTLVAMATNNNAILNQF